jgi:RNA polymerase sigma-70 factor (ECF subfamily)
MRLVIAANRDFSVRSVGFGATTSDGVLVREARAGSRPAFECLYERYWPLAYRTAVLILGDASLAEDVAQEAFLAAIRNLDRFDRRRPLAPWLARIASNRAIDAARARTRRAESQLDLTPGGVTDDVGQGDVIAVIGRLPPDQRAVVALRYVFDLTPGEIAVALDLPRGTINSRLRRGLDALAVSLTDDGGAG